MNERALQMDGHVYDLLRNMHSGRRIVHCREATLDIYNYYE